MKQLQEAISSKANIINQASTQVVNNYYYTEQVKVKTKNHILGIRSDPDVEYHIEWRFRTEKYYKDLSDVDAEINEYLSELDKVENILSKLHHNHEITATKQQELEYSEANLVKAQSQLSETKKKISSYIEGLNGEHRAFILANHFYTKGSEYLCKVLESQGFDANVLAHIALSKNDSTLFDVAINSGANLDSYFVGNKTLLQLVLEKADEQSVKKAIDSTYKCDHTLLNALNQNDLSTIKTLISSKPSLASTLIFNDSTILQYAISRGNKEIINTIIEIAPQSLLSTNNNDETCEQIAKRSGNQEILQLLGIDQMSAGLETAFVLDEEFKDDDVKLQGLLPEDFQNMT